MRVNAPHLSEFRYVLKREAKEIAVNSAQQINPTMFNKSNTLVMFFRTHSAARICAYNEKMGISFLVNQTKFWTCHKFASVSEGGRASTLVYLRKV